MPFVWTNDLDTGVEAMNDEHRILIEKMNHLESLEGTGASSAALRSALEDLVAYTREHFADEEAYMERIGYARIGPHKKAHARVLDKLGEYAAQFESSPDALPFGLVEFLNYWLRSHISVIDKRYGEHAAP